MVEIIDMNVILTEAWNERGGIGVDEFKQADCMVKLRAVKNTGAGGGGVRLNLLHNVRADERRGKQVEAVTTAGGPMYWRTGRGPHSKSTTNWHARRRRVGSARAKNTQAMHHGEPCRRRDGNLRCHPTRVVTAQNYWVL